LQKDSQERHEHPANKSADHSGRSLAHQSAGRQQRQWDGPLRTFARRYRRHRKWGGSQPIAPFDPDKAGNQNARPQGTDNFEILKAETVYFDYDKASVKSSEVPKVQRVATYLKNQQNAYLRVEGNCDERGTEEYNRSLGERRALAVRELLAASGIAADRITTLTNGEDKPSDTGHDETAWSKNRRADFVVITPDAGAIR